MVTVVSNLIYIANIITLRDQDLGGEFSVQDVECILNIQREESGWIIVVYKYNVLLLLVTPIVIII